MLALGTHTTGGLPLQVPDEIRNEDQLLQYFRSWKPACAPGTCRTYSNVGIGALGLIAARSLGSDFDTLADQRLFGPLGLSKTAIAVPEDRMADYAQGYSKAGTPVRLSPGLLSSAAYGVKSTVADMVRYLKASMGSIEIDPSLRQAISETHTGYFQAGPMTQDLVWEQYPYPVELKALLEGNAPALALGATPVTPLSPPEPPRGDVWINKTGSTNGFGAYVAFVPAQRMGIVILANRNFPIARRVTTAYEILAVLSNAAR